MPLTSKLDCFWHRGQSPYGSVESGRPSCFSGSFSPVLPTLCFFRPKIPLNIEPLVDAPAYVTRGLWLSRLAHIQDNWKARDITIRLPAGQRPRAVSFGLDLFAERSANRTRENCLARFPKDVAQQLKGLEKMGAPELRALRLTTFGRPHPGWVQRDFLRRALAYHFQEKVYGGLSGAARRRLTAYAEEAGVKGSQIGRLQRPRIKPGTRLVRSWGGARQHLRIKVGT